MIAAKRDIGAHIPPRLALALIVAIASAAASRRSACAGRVALGPQRGPRGGKVGRRPRKGELIQAAAAAGHRASDQEIGVIGSMLVDFYLLLTPTCHGKGRGRDEEALRWLLDGRPAAPKRTGGTPRKEGKTNGGEGGLYRGASDVVGGRGACACGSDAAVAT